MGKKVYSLFVLLFLLTACFPTNKNAFGENGNGVGLTDGTNGGSTNNAAGSRANVPSSYDYYQNASVLEAVASLQSLDLSSSQNKIKLVDVGTVSISADAFVNTDVQAFFDIYLQGEGSELSEIVNAIESLDGVESLARLSTVTYKQGKIHKYRVYMVPGVTYTPYLEALVDAGISQNMDSGKINYTGSYKLTDSGLSKLTNNDPPPSTPTAPPTGSSGGTSSSKTLVYRYYHNTRNSKNKVTNRYNVYSTNDARSYTPGDGENRYEAFYTYASASADSQLVPVYQYKRNATPAAYRYSIAGSIGGWTKSASPVFYAYTTGGTDRMAVVQLEHETYSGYFLYLPNTATDGHSQSIQNAVGPGPWTRAQTVFYIPR